MTYGFRFFLSWRLAALLIAQIAATCAHFFFASKGNGLVPTLKPLPKILAKHTSREEKFAWLWALEVFAQQPGGSSLVSEFASFLVLCATAGAVVSTAGARIGVISGFVHGARYLVRGRHVLYFPPVQRTRVLQLKQRLPSILVETAGDLVTSLGALLLLTAVLRPRALLAVPAHPLASLQALGSLALVSFSLAVSAAVVEIVQSERIRFGQTEGPLATLSLARDPKQPSVLRALALMDVCAVAEDGRKDSWRQKAIFETPAGASVWTQVATACLQEVDEVTRAAARCRAAAAPAKPEVLTGPAAPITVASVAAAKPAGATTAAAAVVVPLDIECTQALAVCAVQSRAQQITWSVRTLAALAAASREEDKFGHLKLRTPGLKAVLASLLQLRVALQQIRGMILVEFDAGEGASPRGRRRPWLSRVTGPLSRALALPETVRLQLAQLWAQPSPTAALDAVEDTLATCLYWIGGAFGEELRGLELPAEDGSAAELESLLGKMKMKAA